MGYFITMGHPKEPYIIICISSLVNPCIILTHQQLYTINDFIIEKKTLSMVTKKKIKLGQIDILIVEYSTI